MKPEKDAPKEEKPAKPEAKPVARPKAEAKPQEPAPARKVETKPRDTFASGRQDRTVYTHNRKSGQR